MPVQSRGLAIIALLQSWRRFELTKKVFQSACLALAGYATQHFSNDDTRHDDGQVLDDGVS